MKAIEQARALPIPTDCLCRLSATLLAFCRHRRLADTTFGWYGPRRRRSVGWLLVLLRFWVCQNGAMMNQSKWDQV